MTSVDKWEVPYKGGRTTKLRWFKHTGVYLIREKITKEIVYVGMSKSCLYKAMYRHFQSWNDNRQHRVTYNNRPGYEVRLICIDKSKTVYYERRLIRYINPRDNTELYEDANEIQSKYNNEISKEFGEGVGTVNYCPF